MITLQKLKWDNCFSYGSGNELDLDDNSVTQIIGTNGMGKSSIPLIIEEALYNKNSKGIKKVDIPNRYINDGYNISLSFEKDESNYLITIQRKGSIKVKLEKDGEDISSHTATNTYKTIQAILGIDFKTFSQLVYQNTNASLQFLTATDANRKKFLIDLLQLEHYVDLFEVFKAAAKEATTKRTTASAKLATAENWLKNNKLSDLINSGNSFQKANLLNNYLTVTDKNYINKTTVAKSILICKNCKEEKIILKDEMWKN
jgi:DNA repair exonuclease SbcCD ATPase subunit